MNPMYPLSLIRDLVQRNQWRITLTALDCALADFGFGREDVKECILEALQESHFYKSMPAEKRPGLWQDVYRLRFCGENVYLKLQVAETGILWVVSFKDDTSVS